MLICLTFQLFSLSLFSSFGLWFPPTVSVSFLLRPRVSRMNRLSWLSNLSKGKRKFRKIPSRIYLMTLCVTLSIFNVTFVKDFTGKQCKYMSFRCTTNLSGSACALSWPALPLLHVVRPLHCWPTLWISLSLSLSLSLLFLRSAAVFFLTNSEIVSDSTCAWFALSGFLPRTSPINNAKRPTNKAASCLKRKNCNENEIATFYNHVCRLSRAAKRAAAAAVKLASRNAMRTYEICLLPRRQRWLNGRRPDNVAKVPFAWSGASPSKKRKRGRGHETARMLANMDVPSRWATSSCVAPWGILAPTMEIIRRTMLIISSTAYVKGAFRQT